MKLSERVQAKSEERRWLILGVLCFSLLVIVLDNSILNVALPAIVRQLDATNTQLQWMVDAYTLVFAGLLLTAGSLGDRFGRRPALQFGLVVFGLGSLASAMAGSAGALIASRGFMGVGGAFIMPATLSIITNVFPARERGKAIGVWAATAGVAVALGPLTGGFLLEHFYWGSVFLVNLPVVAIGLLAGVFLIPDSKDPSAPRLDPIGAVLSILGLTAALVRHHRGARERLDGPGHHRRLRDRCRPGRRLRVVGAAHRPPDARLHVLQNPRFSAASAAITLTFFAMFGSLFVFSQYLQFVLGYTPLQTGVRLLAFAVPMMIIAPLSARFVHQLGTKHVVAAGMILTATGLVLLSFTGRSNHLRRHRVADGRPGLRPGSHHGPRHGVDHGLPAPGQGWRRLGRQRHHSSGGWRARRRRARQRFHVDLRLSSQQRAERPDPARGRPRASQGLCRRRPPSGRGTSAEARATGSAPPPAQPSSTASTPRCGSGRWSPSSAWSSHSCGCRPELAPGTSIARPKSSRPSTRSCSRIASPPHIVLSRGGHTSWGRPSFHPRTGQRSDGDKGSVLTCR